MAEPKQGETIEELRVTPDKYLPHRYAGASGDFNPIHIDPEFAKSVGLPGSILHGLYVMALVSKAAIDAGGGDPRSLRKLSVQFRGMSFPEQEIVVSGEVTDAGGDDFEIDLVAAQGDNRVIRNARAELDTGKPG
jgi:acyl dehydratase